MPPSAGRQCIRTAWVVLEEDAEAVARTGGGNPLAEREVDDPWLCGDHLLAVFAYIGGFSAATGMVIVALVRAIVPKTRTVFTTSALTAIKPATR